MPEALPPSKAIAAIDDAGFEAGAGQLIFPKGGGPQIHVGVAGFDSSDGASKAVDYLHEQDLQQPCFAACTVTPRDLTVKGIPNSKAVHQVPNPGKPPPGSEKFERWVIEFAIGPDLYIVDTTGDPGAVPKARFEQGAQQVYQYAAKQSG